MSSSKKTGSGKAGPSKADKGKGKATAKPSNIEMKANVRDANGGIEVKTDGGWVPAVYLDEIRDRVLQDTNAQGSYDHPPARGDAALDVTSFHEDHKSWGEARDQRPKILFEYKRTGRQDPDYEVGTWMDNGRVVLGPDASPIRDFRDIPKLCSSQMEGFRMEAISRMDSRIAISDFRARMMRDGLPGANAISMRKTRFRNRGRCLAWDRRAGTDFYEVKLRKEMTQDMIDRNSTEGLEDLSSGKVEKLQLETAGKAPARSGKRALDDNVRAQRLDAAKEKNKLKLEAEAKLKQENTEQQTPLLGSPSRTTHNVVSTTKRKTTMETELRETLREYVDELFQEERPSKKQRTHKSPSDSPLASSSKKRTRTAREAADSNDEEIAEGRVFKRSRQWNPLDLLPSTVGFANPGASTLLVDSANAATSMADFGQPTGPGGNQHAAGWEDGEQLGQRGDTLAYERGESAGSTNTNGDVDDRDMLPISPLEQARVQNALAPTRHQYEVVTGLRAPETNPRESYRSQYHFLQLQFNQVWKGTGIENAPPVLAGLVRWIPGFLGWTQSLDVILNSYGAHGQRLFNELENELRGGLSDMFNQQAPRVDLVPDWKNLGRTNHANAMAFQPILDNEPLPTLDPPAASPPFAGFEPAAYFDPSAGIDPSVLSRPFPVDRPFVASDAPTAFKPFAGFQPSNAFALSPVWNPSEGFAPMAAVETQTSFADAEPLNEASGDAAPVEVGTVAGNVHNQSTNPGGASLLDADDIELGRLLEAAIAEMADPVSPFTPAYPNLGQAADPIFEDPFFGHTFGPENSSFDDFPVSEPQAPETNSLQSAPLEQTVRPEGLSTTGLAEDFAIYCQEPDFWPS